MTRSRVPSPQTLALLSHFLRDPAAWQHGYDLARALDLRSGTLYPILARLDDRGFLQRRQEPSPLAGRPPRQLYRLSDEGAVEAARLIDSASRAARDVPGRPVGRPRPRTQGA